MAMIYDHDAMTIPLAQIQNYLLFTSERLDNFVSSNNFSPLYTYYHDVYITRFFSSIPFYDSKPMGFNIRMLVKYRQGVEIETSTGFEEEYYIIEKIDEEREKTSKLFIDSPVLEVEMEMPLYDYIPLIISMIFFILWTKL
jgi:hypothetical protein